MFIISKKYEMHFSVFVRSFSGPSASVVRDAEFIEFVENDADAVIHPKVAGFVFREPGGLDALHHGGARGLALDGLFQHPFSGDEFLVQKGPVPLTVRAMKQG